MANARSQRLSWGRAGFVTEVGRIMAAIAVGTLLVDPAVAGTIFDPVYKALDSHDDGKVYVLLLLDDDGGHAEPDRLLGRQIVLTQQQRLLDAFAPGDLELIHRPDNVAAMTVRVNRDTLTRLAAHRLVRQAGRDTMDYAYVNGRHSDPRALDLREDSKFVLVEVIAPAERAVRGPRWNERRYITPGDPICTVGLAGLGPRPEDQAPWTPATGDGVTAQGAHSSSTIDLFAVFTPAARNVMGGWADVNQAIGDGIEEINRAFTNSLIDAQIRLVGVSEVDYTESGNVATALAELMLTDDDVIDEVHGWRDCAGADLVAMFLDANNGFAFGFGTGGVPQLGFSVSSIQLTIINQVFSHEVGHNFGCGHQRDLNGSCGGGYIPPDMTQSSCGHIFSVPGQGDFRTINVSGATPRIEHYSNPDVSYPVGDPNGESTGVADSPDPDLAANNARTANLTGPTIATYRATVPDPSPCPPVQLIHVVKGLGATDYGFIYPHDEFCAIDSFEIELSESVSLQSSQASSSGSPIAGPISVTHVSGGTHTVQLSGPIPVGHWVMMRLDLKSDATGNVWPINVHISHLPDDVNQDGTVNIMDATAFGDEFNGLKRPELIDINCDGLVDIRDATAFGNNYHGLNGRQVWNGQSLPPMP